MASTHSGIYLPPEILDNIACYVSPKDITRYIRISRGFHASGLPYLHEGYRIIEWRQQDFDAPYLQDTEPDKLDNRARWSKAHPGDIKGWKSICQLVRTLIEKPHLGEQIEELNLYIFAYKSPLWLPTNDPFLLKPSQHMLLEPSEHGEDTNMDKERFALRRNTGLPDCQMCSMMSIC